MSGHGLVGPVAASVLTMLVVLVGPSDSAARADATVPIRPNASRLVVPPGPLAQAPRRDPSDTEIVAAITAIESANDYGGIVNAVTRHEAVLASPRLVALADQLLQDSTLDANRRGFIVLERQLSIDCRERGAAVAARLLSIRLLAGYALVSSSPQQFAGVLDKFSALAKEVSPQLVREALDTSGNAWPARLLPLMQQLARDWPVLGSLAAATRMAASATPATAATPEPARASTVVGHWRNTAIVFESPVDEHLVLNADGTAETWTVTASSRTPAVRGRWTREATTLNITWEDGRQRSQPFTLFQNQLVLPNIQGRRQFWELIQ